MEPNGVTPELALRAYEAITYYAAWIFAAVAYVAMLSYLVFICLAGMLPPLLLPEGEKRSSSMGRPGLRAVTKRADRL